MSDNREIRIDPSAVLNILDAIDSLNTAQKIDTLARVKQLRDRFEAGDATADEESKTILHAHLKQAARYFNTAQRIRKAVNELDSAIAAASELLTPADAKS